MNKLTSRENFLITLLNKVTKEYKALIEYTRQVKPLKIVDIVELSNVPGETKFAIQIANKNAVLEIKAKDIILGGYDLNQFNDFHSEMIRKAASGKLFEFLQLPSPNASAYKIISKKWERQSGETIFTVRETKNDGVQFALTASSLNENKNLLLHMSAQDIFDIGYTQGSESVAKESIEIEKVKTSSKFPQ